MVWAAGKLTNFPSALGLRLLGDLGQGTQLFLKVSERVWLPSEVCVSGMWLQDPSYLGGIHHLPCLLHVM